MVSETGSVTIIDGACKENGTVVTDVKEVVVIAKNHQSGRKKSRAPDVPRSDQSASETPAPPLVKLVSASTCHTLPSRSDSRSRPGRPPLPSSVRPRVPPRRPRPLSCTVFSADCDECDGRSGVAVVRKPSMKSRPPPPPPRKRNYSCDADERSSANFETAAQFQVASAGEKSETLASDSRSAAPVTSSGPADVDSSAPSENKENDSPQEQIVVETKSVMAPPPPPRPSRSKPHRSSSMYVHQSVARLQVSRSSSSQQNGVEDHGVQSQSSSIKRSSSMSGKSTCKNQVNGEAQVNGEENRSCEGEHLVKDGVGSSNSSNTREVQIITKPATVEEVLVGTGEAIVVEVEQVPEDRKASNEELNTVESIVKRCVGSSEKQDLEANKVQDVNYSEKQDVESSEKQYLETAENHDVNRNEIKDKGTSEHQDFDYVEKHNLDTDGSQDKECSKQSNVESCEIQNVKSDQTQDVVSSGNQDKESIGEQDMEASVKQDVEWSEKVHQDIEEGGVPASENKSEGVTVQEEGCSAAQKEDASKRWVLEYLTDDNSSLASTTSGDTFATANSEVMKSTTLSQKCQSTDDDVFINENLKEVQTTAANDECSGRMSEAADENECDPSTQLQNHVKEEEVQVEVVEAIPVDVSVEPVGENVGDVVNNRQQPVDIHNISMSEPDPKYAKGSGSVKQNIEQPPQRKRATRSPPHAPAFTFQTYSERAPRIGRVEVQSERNKNPDEVVVVHEEPELPSPVTEPTPETAKEPASEPTSSVVNEPAPTNRLDQMNVRLGCYKDKSTAPSGLQRKASVVAVAGRPDISKLCPPPPRSSSFVRPAPVVVNGLSQMFSAQLGARGCSSDSQRHSPPRWTPGQSKSSTMPRHSSFNRAVSSPAVNSPMTFNYRRGGEDVPTVEIVQLKKTSSTLPRQEKNFDSVKPRPTTSQNGASPESASSMTEFKSQSTSALKPTSGTLPRSRVVQVTFSAYGSSGSVDLPSPPGAKSDRAAAIAAITPVLQRQLSASVNK